MYDKFHAYLAELERGYAKLEALLTDKLTALQGYNTARLDEIMKEEQVFVLVSKGFEGNLKGHAKSLGLSGERLSDVLAGLPDQESARFNDVYHKLTARIAGAKAINAKCQELIEERLYSLDKAIKSLDVAQESGYGKDGGAGSRSGEPPSLLSKSV